MIKRALSREKNRLFEIVPAFVIDHMYVGINFVDRFNQATSMGKRKPEFVAYRGDDDDEEARLLIPEARTILLSGNGRRAITTPASPQKSTSASRLPPPVYEWRPPDLEAADQAFLDLAGIEVTVGNVKAKVAAKRYPTSVIFYFGMRMFDC